MGKEINYISGRQDFECIHCNGSMDPWNMEGQLLNNESKTQQPLFPSRPA